MYKIFIYLTAILFSTTLQANSIKGKVTELLGKEKVPMEGVNVFWKGTTHGTVTDENGSFLLKTTNETDTLVASFVGYVTIETEITTTKEISLSMEVNNQLGEVVVFQKSKGSFFNTLEPVQGEKLTGAELHKAACCNLAESFETNPSVDVSYSDAVTGAKQIKLLGLAGIYSQLQTDNMPNLKGLATNYALTYVPGSWMESIQISKGAASVQNGYESITGQVNVEYKKPNSPELVYLSGFATADGFTEFNGNTNIHINEHLSTGVLVYAGNLANRIDNNNDGFMDTPLKTNLHAMNRWMYQKGDFMFQAGINALTEERTGGETSFNRDQVRDITSPYGITIDANRLEVFAKGGYTFKNETSSLAFLGNYVYHDLASTYGLQPYEGRENGMNARLVFSQALDEHSHHNLTAGASILYNYIEEELNQQYVKDEQVPGVFAEYTFKPSHDFTLLAGIRADFHNLFGTFYTPRIHARYEVYHGLTLRASAGKGFRTANLISENSHLMASSRTPDFPSSYYQEEAWNYGVSAVQEIHLGERPVTLSVDFYSTEFQKQMVVDMENSSDQILFYELDGRSYANSLQFDIRYEIFKNFDLTLAYRMNDVKQTIGGELMEKPLTSKYKGLISMNYATNLKKWMFDYTLQFNGGGRMPLTPGAPEEFDVAERFDPFTIMNAQVTRYFKHWNVYLGSENLLDFRQDTPVISADNPYGTWFDAIKVYGPTVGRRIYAGVRFSLNRK